MSWLMEKFTHPNPHDLPPNIYTKHMKTTALLIIAFALCSCGTGTVITFGKDGITVTPPVEPIVIPNTSSK